jgi:hypothetical protein
MFVNNINFINCSPGYYQATTNFLNNLLTDKPDHIMKHIFIGVICFVLFLSACRQIHVNIVTYDLKRRDFVEKIEAEGTVQAVKNLAIVAPSVFANPLTVTHMAPMGSFVKKGDTICVLEAPQLLKYLENFTDNLENTQTELTKMEANNVLNMSMLLAQVEQNQAQMAISRLDSVQMKFAPPVKQQLLALELEMAKVEERKLTKKLEAQKKINESEIRQVKSRIIQAENYVQILRDQISKLTVTAPQDGMVAPSESPIMMFESMDGSSGSIGGDIKEGSKVYGEMSLVNLPDLSEMQVAVTVPENDYKRIDKGQKVTIRVDAADNLITTGMVKKKSLVGKSNQAETKVKEYEIIISVDSCHSRMKPGLGAECEITINLTRDTVVIPTLAIFERDSSKVVYVSKGEKFVPVTIETGQSNSSVTIITKGLQGNETIALMEPPENYIEKQKK